MPTPNFKAPARQWITRAQAAERLACTERYIDKLVQRGHLAGYKLGTKAVRLDAAEVDALLTPIPTAKARGEAAA